MHFSFEFTLCHFDLVEEGDLCILKLIYFSGNLWGIDILEIPAPLLELVWTPKV